MLEARDINTVNTINTINTECGQKLTASGYSEKGCRGKQMFPRCSVIFPPAPYRHWRRHHATESPGQHECGLCIPALWSRFELLIAAGGKSGQMQEVNSSSLCYLFHKASASNDIERSQEGCSRCKPLPPLLCPSESSSSVHTHSDGCFESWLNALSSSLYLQWVVQITVSFVSFLFKTVNILKPLECSRNFLSFPCNA